MAGVDDAAVDGVEDLEGAHHRARRHHAHRNAHHAVNDHAESICMVKYGRMLMRYKTMDWEPIQTAIVEQALFLNGIGHWVPHISM